MSLMSTVWCICSERREERYEEEDEDGDERGVKEDEDEEEEASKGGAQLQGRRGRCRDSPKVQ